MNKFFAHSTDDPSQSNWQPLDQHLKSVAEIAGRNASFFGSAELASAAGLLHDIGKYTQEFQHRISGRSIRVDHATRGAMLAVEKYGQLGYLLAYPIAGHHAGLANGVGGQERTALQDRLRGRGLPALLETWKQEISLPESLIAPGKFQVCSDRGNFQLAFLSRMIFSCLVDADFLDTETFYDRVENRPSFRKTSVPGMGQLLERLEVCLSRFASDSPVNKIRADILRTVRARSVFEPGLFSLTVPTGGGKTLASLAFALDHAIRHGLRRVIFVIPFTSIVEQTSAVFRTALGDLGESAVLEHHSAFVAPNPSKQDPDRYQAKTKLRLAMENWDAPIVVTTAVQFFESLFAARTSQCRKLHNIAGSVVILDEAQTLPLKVLKPTMAAIEELARNYRCSLVLCTATQPALLAPKFEGGFEKKAVRELAPEPERLFKKLERVKIRHLGVLDDMALSEQLRSREQVLCIVNNRRHARALFEAMADLPGARHLTTLMCSKHRSEVLTEIRQMLVQQQPCRLVATSLIEAGVDVSFPTVFRVEAGLDSIAQAAGRCNRNGERPVEQSEVFVFQNRNEDWAPPPELKQFAQAARSALRQHGEAPMSPKAIEAYFDELYWQKGPQQLDVHDLMGCLNQSRPDSLPFETLAEKYRLIDTVQMPVIVPYRSGAGSDVTAEELLRSLRFVEKSGGIARKLQPYIVQLPQRTFDSMVQAGAIQPVAPDKWDQQFMELVNTDLYDPRFGLNTDEPSFHKSENLIW